MFFPARAIGTGQSVSTEKDYEIRFLKADGSTSLVFVTRCASDEDAQETAERMLTDDFFGYEIWRGHVRVLLK